MQSVETEKFRVTNFLFIGILVCVPLLALYHFGFFPQTATWLGSRLPRLLVLPEDGVKTCRILQYTYYTGAAFLCAWLGLSLRAMWQKLGFLLGFSYLTLGFTVVLAWAGILFEPFSGIAAAWVAFLAALVVADLDHSQTAPPAATEAVSPTKAEPAPANLVPEEKTDEAAKPESGESAAAPDIAPATSDKTAQAPKEAPKTPAPKGGKGRRS